MTYIPNPLIAMTISRPNAPAHPLVLSALALAFTSLTACANQPKSAAAPAATGSLATPCKAGETVGFSCELRDHRVIAVCASPGFGKFQGDPKDNPGYVYLTVASGAGKGQQAFPEQAKDFRQHMSTGVTAAGAPYLNVATEKGNFFYVNGRADIPVSSNPQNQPAGWTLPANGDDSLCANKGNREHFDEVLSQIPKKAK